LLGEVKNKKINLLTSQTTF